MSAQLSIYAENSRKCIAEAIFREAGGEPLSGKYAIGEVILNRIRYGMGKTACDVVNKHFKNHWQFGYKKSKHKEIPQYFYDIAQKILDRTDNFIIPANILFFNNLPFKRSKYVLYKRIGHQYFYSKRK